MYVLFIIVHLYIEYEKLTDGKRGKSTKVTLFQLNHWIFKFIEGHNKAELLDRELL